MAFSIRVIPCLFSDERCANWTTEEIQRIVNQKNAMVVLLADSLKDLPDGACRRRSGSPGCCIAKQKDYSIVLVGGSRTPSAASQAVARMKQRYFKKTWISSSEECHDNRCRCR